MDFYLLPYLIFKGSKLKYLQIFKIVNYKGDYMVCVIGLGYVGLPLALSLSDAGFKVYGIEINKVVVDSLRKGNARIYEPGLQKLLTKHLNKNFFVETELTDEIVSNVSSYIITVGTPVNEEGEPNLQHIKDVIIKEIGPVLKKGQLIILRSTVPIGGTRNFFKQMLEEKSGLKAGEDFLLVYAPERIVQGKAIEELRTLPQIIGGINDESIDAAENVFKKLTDKIIKVSSLEAAEVIKLIDNVYRYVNISLGNEFGFLCEKLGLNAFEIIRAANEGYERNKIMTPGPGVGGSCLLKDTHQMIYSAKKIGVDLPLLNTAMKINENMAKHTFSLVDDMCKKMEKEMKGSKIFIMGLAFKGHPETDDTRNTAAKILADELKRKEAMVLGYDPVIKPEKIEEFGIYPCSIKEGFEKADCIVVMNNHKSFSELNLEELSKNVKRPVAIIDGWNIFNPEEVSKLGLFYKGVGIG